MENENRTFPEVLSNHGTIRLSRSRADMSREMPWIWVAVTGGVTLLPGIDHPHPLAHQPACISSVCLSASISSSTVRAGSNSVSA